MQCIVLLEQDALEKVYEVACSPMHLSGCLAFLNEVLNSLKVLSAAIENTYL
jgi:hypothetical protein